MSPIPSLVIRRHDPARQRRTRLLVAAMWLGSLLIVAGLVATFVARAPGEDHSAELAAARKEGEALKSRIAVLERSEQIAKAALGDVQQTLRDREEEIDGLRADLAFYGRLVGGGKREGLAVHALRIAPVAGSQAWNFTATLTQNFKRGADVRGRLTLSVEGIADGKLSTLDWSALSQGQDASGIEYRFKYFQQVGGTIMLPAGFAANRVVVRADGDSGRVEQEFSWKDAVKGEESDNVSQ
ncbi:DUF6776 family protein [Dokdonella fugitiva]|jgi:hypothetical protein|uniref:Transmembrane protein n=1 Tax=Dokdonella fugitiva TaxID=328517 RepID=A0A4R2HZL0_9GAMM|nr:DUF6776 family protein [Dokdonella fugitiva]MBA8883725.1 hypothetical protein [Dokdonella fugitiva]TCO36108.1 hypothetical protein EV148_11430 [Dokdonella fugitiva]